MKCPHCNKETNVHPVYSLWKHVQSNVETSKRQLRHTQKHIDQGTKGYGPKAIQKGQANLAKWEQWSQVLWDKFSDEIGE